MTVQPAEGGYARPEVVGGSSCSSESRGRRLGWPYQGICCRSRVGTTDPPGTRNHQHPCIEGFSNVCKCRILRGGSMAGVKSLRHRDFDIPRVFVQPRRTENPLAGQPYRGAANSQPPASVRRGLVRRPSTPRIHAPSSGMNRRSSQRSRLNKADRVPPDIILTVYQGPSAD